MYADNTSGHNLMRYSTSNSPYGPFKDGGVILDATSCDTTHGSIVEYKNHWYMFYHNSDLSGRGNLRSVCVDEVFFNEDGSIQKVNQTKDGVSAVGPVVPNEYESLHKTYDKSEFVEKTDYGLTNVEVKNANFNGKTISGFRIDNATANTGYFLRFDPTTAWNDYTGVATCIVDLNPGTNNTIKLTGSMGGVNINGFSVSLLDQTIPETTTTAPATTVPPTTTPTTAPTITPKATTENPGTSQTTSATESSSLESVTSTSSNVTSDVVTSSDENASSDVATSVDENASSDVVTSSSENVSSDIATSDNESVYSNVTTKTDKATSKIVVKKSKVKKAVKKRKAAKIKITLKKVFKAKYLVKVSTSKKFSKKKTVTKIVKKASFVFKTKRFRNKKKLYVKVRALKKVDNTIIYSKWSKPKKIKLK